MRTLTEIPGHACPRGDTWACMPSRRHQEPPVHALAAHPRHHAGLTGACLPKAGAGAQPFDARQHHGRRVRLSDGGCSQPVGLNKQVSPFQAVKASCIAPASDGVMDDVGEIRLADLTNAWSRLP
eukprot:181217-Chlamydomonas_euryale.AAC.4